MLIIADIDWLSYIVQGGSLGLLAVLTIHVWPRQQREFTASLKMVVDHCDEEMNKTRDRADKREAAMHAKVDRNSDELAKNTRSLEVFTLAVAGRSNGGTSK